MDTEETSALRITVYQDESGDFGHGAWVFVGLLWVPRDRIATLTEALREARNGFAGEVHFYRFARNFQGEYGAGARTGRAWLERWLSDWRHETWLTALAVNRRHPLYPAARFHSSEDAYNHFAAEALARGLTWHFAGAQGVTLDVCSDARSLPTSDRGGSPGVPSRFAEALRARLANREMETPTLPAALWDNPPVRFAGERVADRPFSADEEVLQLTDVLLGAVATAISPLSRAATKLHLAREMARLMDDLRRPPREGPAASRRRVRILYYPDADGRYTTSGPVGLWDI